MRIIPVSLSAISLFLFLNSIHAAEIRVFPEPEHIEFTGERFDLDEAVNIAFDGSEVAIQQVAQHLSQEMASRFQVPLGLKKSTEANPDQKTIFLGLLSDPGISDVFNRSGVKPDPGLNGPEGYQLAVTSSAVIVAGNDISGLFYGIQSLFQLVDYQGRGEGFQGRASIRGVLISDRPFKPFRGIHLYLPARDDIPFFKKFIKFLAGYKVNTLIIEVGGGMWLDQTSRNQYCLGTFHTIDV